MPKLITAKIKSDPRMLFFYIPVPAVTSEHLGKLEQGQTSEPEDRDHCTLIWMPKSEQAVPPERITEVIDATKEVCRQFDPIRANIQGWAYFDGAVKDKQPKTALVALVDAPGLIELYVALKAKLNSIGITWTPTHGYVPHITAGYMPPGTRVAILPDIKLNMPDASQFMIDRIFLANTETYEIKLKPSESVARACVVAGLLKNRGHEDIASDLLDLVSPNV